MGGFLAQYLHAQRVEGGNGNAADFLCTEQLAHPFQHFARGLVGKGDGGDMPCRDIAVADQVGDLVGNHPRFAGARPGQYQQGTVEVMDCFALRRIKLWCGHGWNSGKEGRRWQKRSAALHGGNQGAAL